MINTEHVDADASRKDKKLARKLFREARKLMRKHEYQRALKKLLASQSRNPKALGTKLNIAVCHEKIGNLVQAWHLFRELEEVLLKEGGKRAAYAHKQANILKARISTLIILVPYIGQTPNMTLTLNEKPIKVNRSGKTIHVNPGIYYITASARNHRSFTRQIELREGEKEDVTIPMLESESIWEKEKPRSGSWWSRHRKSTITSGVSIVLLGTGLGLGMKTWMNQVALSEGCLQTSTGCSAHQVNQVNRYAIATNVVLGASAATAITSLILYFTIERASKQRLRVVVVPNSNGLFMTIRH